MKLNIILKLIIILIIGIISWYITANIINNKVDLNFKNFLSILFSFDVNKWMNKDFQLYCGSFITTFVLFSFIIYPINLVIDKVTLSDEDIFYD